ncbi:hypothetical protein ES703_93778 [subsurface metagenome]
MLNSLITKDGSVVGATAVNVRNGKFLVFKAKATLLSTGGAQARMYSYPFAAFPNNLFFSYNSPNNAGGGAAAAYRAGVKLINLEWLFILPFVAGFGTYQGAATVDPPINSKGENIWAKYPEIPKQYPTGGFLPFTNYVYSPNMSEAEMERDVLMFDTTTYSEEKEWFGSFMSANEWPFVLKLMRDRGGLRKAPYEQFPQLLGIPRNFSGVWPVNEKGETSLKNLFVAGDVGGALPLYGVPAATGWGYRIGRYLGKYAPDITKPEFDGEQLKQVQAERERVLAPLGRKKEVNTYELEDLTRKIMTYYVGIHKTEPKLKRCLELLKVAKEKFLPKLGASNPHELMRALEVQDIIELSELHTQASLLRAETRFPPAHYRVDYPEQDDAHWKKNIVIQNVAGEMKYTLETLD